MLRELIKHLTAWAQELLNPATLPNTTNILFEYQQSLSTYQKDDANSLLKILITRDQIEEYRNKYLMFDAEQTSFLSDLDEKLHQILLLTTVKIIPFWRRTHQPPKKHWWWYLDQELADQQKGKDILWEALTVILFFSTTTITADILRRLWSHAPDNWAIFGSLLTLIITASPLTKNSVEYLSLFLQKISKKTIVYQAKTVTLTAFFSLLLILVLRFFYLPQLANIYNDRGVIALQDGQLNSAKQYFQRAIAINNDLAPSYYNLAAAYEKIGRYEDAVSWYEQAMDYDLQFAPAYNNLGRLYLLQNEPEKAQEILLAGLTVLSNSNPEQETYSVTNYRILTHLGQSYFEQGILELAVITLERAVELENGEGLAPQFYSARPHYYLALSYEALSSSPAEIIKQWELALSYLNPEDPATWNLIITNKLLEWR